MHTKYTRPASRVLLHDCSRLTAILGNDVVVTFLHRNEQIHDTRLLRLSRHLCDILRLRRTSVDVEKARHQQMAVAVYRLIERRQSHAGRIYLHNNAFLLQYRRIGQINSRRYDTCVCIKSFHVSSQTNCYANPKDVSSSPHGRSSFPPHQSCHAIRNTACIVHHISPSRRAQGGKSCL